MNHDATPDGGPAFPASEWLDTMDPHTVNPVRHLGMSLRDRYAETTMREVLVALRNSHGLTADRPDNVLRQIANLSYRMADAMMAARKEQSA
jgi:hypothetical protein